MHIFKRNKIYYYKIIIPKNFHSLIPKKVVKFSLRTKKRSDALLIASTISAKYSKLFLQLNSGIYNQEEILRLINKTLYLNLSHQNLNTSTVVKDEVREVKEVSKELPKVKTLKEISIQYSQDKLETNVWTEKTYRAYSHVFLIFSKLIDKNRDIKKVAREDLQSFKSVKRSAKMVS